MSEYGSDQPDYNNYDQYQEDTIGLGFEDGLPIVHDEAMPGEDYEDWDTSDTGNPAVEADDYLAKPFLEFDDEANERLVKYGDATAGIVRDEEEAVAETIPVSPPPVAAQTRTRPEGAEASPWPYNTDGQPIGRAPQQEAEMVAPPQEAQNTHVIPDDRTDYRVNGPIYEGTIIERDDPAERPFDRALLDLGRNIVLVGKEREDADEALFQTVVSEVDKLNATRGKKVVVVVDAAPGPDSLFAVNHDPSRYNLVEVEATGNALTAQLTPGQLGEALAALTTHDIGERAQFKSLYSTLAHGLATRVQNERGEDVINDDGSYAVRPPTVQQMSAAINYYTAAQRGDHSRELSSLTPEQWDTIEITNLIGSARQEVWKPLFPRAKAFLESSYPRGAKDALPLQELGQIRNASIESDDPDVLTPNTTILLVKMGARYGEELRAARTKTVASLLPILAERTEWLGEPAALVVAHGDRLPKRDEPGAEAADELMTLAIVDKRMPTVVSASKLTEDSAWYLRSGVFGLMPMDSTTAKVVSASIGPKIRSDVGSISGGTSFNDGVNVSGGTGGSFEPGNDYAANTNSNAGGGASIGSAAHIDKTINVAEGPRVRESDLGELRPGHIGVAGAFGGFRSPAAEGLYSLYEREHLGVWPPEGDDVHEVVREVMDGLEAKMDAMEKRIAAQFGRMAAGRTQELEPGRRAALPPPPVENGHVRSNNYHRNLAEIKAEFVAYQHSVRNHNRTAGRRGDPRPVPRTWQEYTQIKCDEEHYRAHQRALRLTAEAHQDGNPRAMLSDFYDPNQYTLDAYIRRRGLVK